MQLGARHSLRNGSYSTVRFGRAAHQLHPHQQTFATTIKSLFLVSSTSACIAASFGVATLLSIELRQVVDQLGDNGMVGTERFLRDRERPSEERFGFGVAPLRLIERAQIVERLRSAWAIGTEHFFLYRPRPPVQRLGVSELTLGLINDG
jgi:hypothetical protein